MNLMRELILPFLMSWKDTSNLIFLIMLIALIILNVCLIKTDTIE